MRFVLLIVAAVVAVVAGVTALKLSGEKSPEPTTSTATSTSILPTSVSTVDVLVARQQIPVGTIIKPEMISKQPWPAHLVLESFIVSTGENDDVVGRVARSTFLPYEPLLKSRLSNPNDPSFLAAVLPEGMRAMTLATDVISGVAGYIFPGDRVDILITHNVPGDAEKDRNASAFRANNNKPAFTEVLVPNARVLAVNLRPPDGLDATASNNTAPTSITLEVPESVAQEIRLAERLGTLSLTLRSLKDIDNNEVPVPTTYEDITHASNLHTGAIVRIIRGIDKSADKETTFTPDDGTRAIDNPLDESQQRSLEEDTAGSNSMMKTE